MKTKLKDIQGGKRFEHYDCADSCITLGTVPLIITKFGGSTRQQTMGMTLGALTFAVIVFFFTDPVYTLKTVGISFITGCLWTVGQMFQLQAFKIIGVSKAMPISTGMQLVGTTLCG